jgi:hypothetical protein
MSAERKHIQDLVTAKLVLAINWKQSKQLTGLRRANSPCGAGQDVEAGDRDSMLSCTRELPPSPRAAAAAAPTASNSRRGSKQPWQREEAAMAAGHVVAMRLDAGGAPLTSF